jgi:hypothetical protein
MGQTLSLDEAARLVKERTGRAIEPRSVRDVSLRIVVLQQWIERRTIEIVSVPRRADTEPTRDLEAELWSLPVTPPAVFNDHLEVVSDPRTGAVRRCPDCDGAGRRKCSRCGGLASLVCGACDGRGHIHRRNNAYDPCFHCGADGRIGCTECTIGTHPCSSCNESGSTFTEQRAKVQWVSRSQQMPLSRPPSTVDLQGEKPVRAQTYECESGVFRPTIHGGGEHFRAYAFAQSTDELDAIHQLVRQNPAVVHERINAQRAWVDQVEVWQIDAGTEHEPITLYAIGRERTLVGVEALKTGPGPVVAIVAMGLGVIAILAGSVLR